MKKGFCILLASLCFSNLLAEEYIPDSPTVHSSDLALEYGGKEEMNGLKLIDYADFDKKWKQITVRYRKDNREMRFVYANPIAEKAMKQGKKVFPEGSVFAKIGAISTEDPFFTSSEVPAGAVRYQLMVKDSKRFKETNGWGYALFNAEGVTFPEEPKAKTVSCHTCHQLVPDKDYVFSEVMEISPLTAKYRMKKIIADKKTRIKFAQIKRNELPPVLALTLPKHFDEFQSIQGDLRNYIFDGTMSEIRPLLIKNTIKTNMPSILFNEDHTRFIVVNRAEVASCGNNGKGRLYHITHSLPGGNNSPDKSQKFMQENYCDE